MFCIAYKHHNKMYKTRRVLEEKNMEIGSVAFVGNELAVH